MVEAKIIKSRSNAAGNTVKLVFDQFNGFDNLLSNFTFLKDQGQMGGAGRSYYLPNYDKVKFAQKEFKAKFYADANLQKKFYELLIPELEKFVPETSTKGLDEAGILNSILAESVVDFENLQLVEDEAGTQYRYDDSNNKYYDLSGKDVTKMFT